MLHKKHGKRSSKTVTACLCGYYEHPEESTVGDVQEKFKKTAMFFTLWESRETFAQLPRESFCGKDSLTLISICHSKTGLFSSFG
jgi:hypothetical protein